MADLRLKNLDKLTVFREPNDIRHLSMNRPTSMSGKVMERCPNPECKPAIFQLGQAPETRELSGVAQVRRKPGEDGITCPYCGIDGKDSDFIAKEDFDHAIKEVEHAIIQDFSEMLGGIARQFNQQAAGSRNNMVSMTMEHTPTRNPKPFAYREDLLRGIACHVCQREYGVYALALFCPDCGSPNVSTHFDREIEIIDQQVEISKLIDSDENREVAYRLLANAHEDALTALETTLKAVYKHLAPLRSPDQIGDFDKFGSAFQNLEKSQKLFAGIGISLLGSLSGEESDALFKAIQKRHVIGHNLGLADEKYLKVSGDTEVGRNVPVLAEEIEHFTALCSKLISSVEKELGYAS